MRTLLPFLLSILVVVALFSCSRPVPPTLTAERVEVVDTSPASFIARVHCRGHNPNAFPIPVTSVRGAIRFEQTDTAGVTASSTSVLAPKADTDVVLDVKGDWSTVSTTVGNAGAGAMVNYTASGTATLDVSGTDVTIPFSVKGQVEKKAIALAVLRHVGLPKRLPDDIREKLAARRLAASASASGVPAPAPSPSE